VSSAGPTSLAGELSIALRVRAWDAALAAVREYLRGSGLREVSTAVRVDAVALEPWIDPLASEERLLITSPELAMKRLLARGSGAVFQIAHVFRRAERGARHSEEFHLIEWYRERGDEPDSLGVVMHDVEQLVARVFAAVEAELGARSPGPPQRWDRVNLLALMGETLGCEFVGNEPAELIESQLRRVRTEAAVGLDAHVGTRIDDAELARLLAWTELFSLWSDVVFDPWLRARGQGIGVHVEGFPASLAALAEVDTRRRVGARFESHVGVVELANGYSELRDAVEQRRRFELVAAMRAVHGQAPLPMPESFLAELGDMPPCVGVALGLDRLVALACGCERLDQVALGL
jgi:lysyl-tRNA synthetase class 2